MWPLLLGVGAALATYHGAALAAEAILGPAPRPGQLARTVALLRGAAPPASPGPLRRLAGLLVPPDLPARPFLLRLFGTWAGLLAGGLVLFHSWAPALGLTLAGLYYRNHLIRATRRQQRELLNYQFRDALESLAGSLRAGASLPTALDRAVHDLRRLLAGQPGAPILAHLEQVVQELRLGSTLDEALLRFRDRTGLEDVADFVHATLLCQARGGNLARTMAHMADMIGGKVQVRRQVQVVTAGKRYEAWLLTVVPPVLVAVLAYSSPDYLAPLYHTRLGQLLLLAASAMLVAAYFVGRRLAEVDV